MSDATGRGQGHQTSAQVTEQPRSEAGVVRAGAAPVVHERPEDWGWHGEAGKAGRITGILMIPILLVMLVGNHEGRVEDLWLVGAALLILISLIWDSRRRKNAWRSR